MDPRYSAQDVLRCHLCDTAVPPLCCDLCQIYLCKVCVGEHILDVSTEHKVVPIQQALSDPVYPRCSKHSPESCRLHCKQCITPICVHCASSKGHRGHEFVDFLKYVESKKNELQGDVLEMESSVLIKYKEIASGMKIQRANLRETADSLKIAIDERAEKLYKQVGAIVKKLKSEVDEKEDTEFSVLNEEEEKIATKISSIEEYILHQKDLQTTRDLGRVYAYRSRNQEFRNVPPKHIVTMPTLSGNDISTDELLAQFGSLQITKSLYQGLETQEAQSLASDKQLTDKTEKRVRFQQADVETDLYEKNQFKNEFEQVDPEQQQLTDMIKSSSQSRHFNPGYLRFLPQSVRMWQKNQGSPLLSALKPARAWQRNSDQISGRSQDNMKPPQFECSLCHETFPDFSTQWCHEQNCSMWTQ